MKLDHCKTCGAEVRWITSPAGRPQIVDAEERRAWVTDEPNRASARILVLIEPETGQMVRGYPGSVTMDGAREIRGHLSHWASCTTPPKRRT